MQSAAVVERPIAVRSWLLGGLAAALAAVGGLALARIVVPASPVAGAAPVAVSPVAALANLPAAAQAPVSAGLGRAERAYWVHGLAAANALNHLSARFGTGAVAVTATGGGSVRFALPGSGSPRIQANRVSYGDGRVTAAYANGPLGLEQSFVLVRGDAVSLLVGGSLHPALRDGGLLFSGGGVTLRYTGLIATDARGRRLPARISLRGDRLTLSADTRGARYPVRIDPFVQAANLNEASPPQDAFGYSSRDGRVRSGGGGERYDDRGHRRAGWRRPDLQRRLRVRAIRGRVGERPPGRRALPRGRSVRQRQERSVAIRGRQDDPGGSPTAGSSEQGIAFVFAEPGSGWQDATSASATLTASDGATADSFGFATGASDDAVVVSAPSHAVGGTESIGGIYIYDEPAAGWSGTLTQTQEVNPGTTSVAEAGYSLGFDGATIVAGSRGNSQGEWVFTNAATGRTTTGRTPTGTTPTERAASRISQAAPPVNIVPPSISGTAKAGETLTCAHGTWTNSPTAYAYQWSYDGTPISGATGSTYVVAAIDEGLHLTCTVTASNARGAGTPATSAAFAIPVPKVKKCPGAS